MGSVWEAKRKVYGKRMGSEKKSIWEAYGKRKEKYMGCVKWECVNIITKYLL
jgi:hypothetical protein